MWRCMGYNKEYGTRMTKHHFRAICYGGVVTCFKGVWSSESRVLVHNLKRWMLKDTRLQFYMCFAWMWNLVYHFKKEHHRSSVFDPLWYSHSCMYVCMSLIITTLHSVFTCYVWFSRQTAIISLNSVNHLNFVMVKCFFFLRYGLNS
jgi:hypothetical protein